MAGMLHTLENRNHGAPHTHGPSQCEGPSYGSTYQEVHSKELERLRSCLQRPEPGSFMHADLQWASHMRVTGRRSDPRMPAEVSIAYIPWVRVTDFLKGEEARPDAPCKFVCQGKTSNKQGALMFPRWNCYSAVIKCLCNMSFDQNYAICTCYRVWASPFLVTYYDFKYNFCLPYPCRASIIASMDQTTIHRTYQWLQMICIRRNGSWMRRANSFQMERVTRVRAHLRECEDRGNEGGANVVLSSSDCT